MKSFNFFCAFICFYFFMYGAIVLTLPEYFSGHADMMEMTPFWWIPAWIALLWLLDCIFVQLPNTDCDEDSLELHLKEQQ